MKSFSPFCNILIDCKQLQVMILAYLICFQERINNFTDVKGVELPKVISNNLETIFQDLLAKSIKIFFYEQINESKGTLKLI